MGVIGTCTRCSGILVLLASLLIGWLSTHLHPLGTVFATVFKVQGALSSKPGTEPVPDDLAPAPRPAGEILFDLPSGDRMPANGIGMCCRPTAYDPVSVHRTVLWFLLQGGRHVDTASMYLNHESVGSAIKEAVARGVPRKEIFLTTKVAPDHFGYEESIKRAEDMIKELGVDYIDLVLLHAPILMKPSAIGKYLYAKYVTGGDIDAKFGDSAEHRQARIATWRGLSTLHEKGLIRNLGVSNFNIKYMKEIQALEGSTRFAHIAPLAANQLQYHPWAPDWMEEIVGYCHQNQIVVTGYFSLGGSDKTDTLLDVQALNDVAKEHGRRPAQVLLRWNLQKNVSIIPGTGNPKHMADNLAAYGFSLSEKDMARLGGMASLPLKEKFMFFDF